MPKAPMANAERNLEKRAQGELNFRQEKWCQLMATGNFSGAQAARAAGYGAGTSNKTACRLKAMPACIKLLEKLRVEAGERNSVSLDEVISGLREARDSAMASGAWAASIRATELLGKYLGMFSDTKVGTQAISAISTGSERLSTIAGLRRKES